MNSRQEDESCRFVNEKLICDQGAGGLVAVLELVAGASSVRLLSQLRQAFSWYRRAGHDAREATAISGDRPPYLARKFLGCPPLCDVGRIPPGVNLC
jgi:hypothetical protein